MPRSIHASASSASRSSDGFGGVSVCGGAAGFTVI
jgi:hypothetical protein